MILNDCFTSLEIVKRLMLWTIRLRIKLRCIKRRILRRIKWRRIYGNNNEHVTMYFWYFVIFSWAFLIRFFKKFKYLHYHLVLAEHPITLTNYEVFTFGVIINCTQTMKFKCLFSIVFKTAFQRIAPY